MNILERQKHQGQRRDREIGIEMRLSFFLLVLICLPSRLTEGFSLTASRLASRRRILQGRNVAILSKSSSSSEIENDETSLKASRRRFLVQGGFVFVTTIGTTGSTSLALEAAASQQAPLPTVVRTPLEYVSALGAYVVHFNLFGESFGAILDTGSPFLTVPYRCNKFAYKYRWGCYRPERTRDSGYTNTVEAFDNNQGPVVWRKADFSFQEQPSDGSSSNSNSNTTQDIVFGVFGEELMDGPGGCFFGLIKDTDKWIRPSFLGQTSYTSFCVDLRQQEQDGPLGRLSPQLVLSQESLLDGEDDDYIPLVRDLNRRFKAPLVHYTARPNSFVVNGLPLRLDKLHPAYVIFDTGVTGMIVDQELFDGRYRQARKNREKSLWGHVRVTFRTRQGNLVELNATKPVTSPLGTLSAFKGFKGILIVLGLAFLDGRAMTIDAECDKLKFLA